METPTSRLLTAFRSVLERFPDEPVAGFRSAIGWTMAARNLVPNELACLRHLDDVAAIAPPFAQPIASLLADDGHRFRWGQTYTEADFGRHFIDNYGWLEVFGTRGHFFNDTIAGGVMLLGPGVVYPDHHHVAEEIYIPLTGGTAWRMGEGAFAPRAAGAVIHHASNVSHAMRTGDDPLLALYLWRGGPLAARSTITAKRD